MRKKILLLLCFIIAFISLWNINNNYYAIWNNNSHEVKVDSPLSIKKVKIEYGNSANTSNRPNDKIKFIKHSKYTVLYDGRNWKDLIPNEYGENDFLITYDEKYYLQFRHFKTNRSHQHAYTFHLFENNDKVFINVKIVGRDEVYLLREMKKMD